ncbi:MAG: hypothetical protein PVG55_04600, partial [Nitrospirota bacterium]
MAKGLRDRKSFGHIEAAFAVPNLIEIQKKSYEQFLQRDLPSEKRDDVGLQAALKSVFPIEDYNRTASIEFVEFTVGEPKFDVRACMHKGITFAAPLKIRV